MPSPRSALRAALPALAPLPALVIGIMAMRQLGVSTIAWAINIAATVLGLLLWLVVRRLPPPARPATLTMLTAASIAMIVLPFAFAGMLGVHRWIALGGLRLHASAIVAPLIVLCVAAAASTGIGRALAIGAIATIVLALQPDAAQTVSFAAAVAVVIANTRAKQTHKLLAVALLIAIAAASFVRRDPLPPVAHVEEIFSVVSAKGPASAAMATVALLLLPLPFFATWYRHRSVLSLALGVYVTMTLLAPVWGTFPVPVMGSGASPILGYFLALALGAGEPSRIEEHAS